MLELKNKITDKLMPVIFFSIQLFQQFFSLTILVSCNSITNSCYLSHLLIFRYKVFIHRRNKHFCCWVVCIWEIF